MYRNSGGLVTGVVDVTAVRICFVFDLTLEPFEGSIGLAKHLSVSALIFSENIFLRPSYEHLGTS